ncbi:DAK2 domain-containing protein [Corynebacterium pilosum]|uniref:Kinase related to dihydroxyacetone kinase n=1 Tax=Corynebacterium pilosum TaxID=35756 RepID=A0A376CQH5_9CORY|nr:DAK2 domain-containing protein [Corynebacterium pilosum]STC70329.1 kinase related to dihydroxyacetone kinase [Corynebacterium pilosum]
MSYPVELDGARLQSWARHAAEELNRRRADINALNVFPVPDADTGSNMAHTMAAAVESASALNDDAPAHKVAGALATGSIRGARGNSGVVLSQVLRGLAHSASQGPIGADAVAHALTMAVEFVDRAIADPVEGTVLTVLRAAAGAATAATAEGELVDVSRTAYDAACTALANTPSQLDVLREAGVVDAGGAGLVVLLETLLQEITGQEVERSSISNEPVRAQAELEVMFYYRGDVTELEGVLAPLGNSLVVARASDSEATVHIHSADAGRLIEAAFAHGEVSDLRLEVLPEGPRTQAPSRVVLAVTPPGSLSDLYQQAGATVVAPGETVVSEILSAIRASGAQEVVLLPNGLLSNRALVAVEKATAAFEQSIMLLPTVRLVSGIAALAVHDPDQPLATASYTMSEAAGEMRTAVVTRAERAALTQAGACAKGDYLAHAHGDITAVGDTLTETVETCCARLLESGGEQVTLLVGKGALDDEHLSSALGVDVVVYPADGLTVEAEIGVE